MPIIASTDRPTRASGEGRGVVGSFTGFGASYRQLDHPFHQHAAGKKREGADHALGWSDFRQSRRETLINSLKLAKAFMNFLAAVLLASARLWGRAHEFTILADHPPARLSALGLGLPIWAPIQRAVSINWSRS